MHVDFGMSTLAVTRIRAYKEERCVFFFFIYRSLSEIYRVEIYIFSEVEKDDGGV